MKRTTLGLGIFFIFSFVSLAPTAQASITQSQCVAFDNSKKMGPVRDQRTNGLCWTFAGTALIEEELCHQDPRECGKSYSPLDASRCTWTLGSQDQGGLARYALNCALQNGICAEDKAPYDAKVDVNLSCTKTPVQIKKQEPTSCADPKTQREYQEFLEEEKIQGAAVACKDFDREQKNLEDFILPGKQISDEFVCQEKDYTLSPEGKFRKKMLISNDCKNNRKKIAGADQLKGTFTVFPGGTENIKKTSASDKYDKLARVFRDNGRSTALSVCLNKLSPELAKIYAPSDNDCSGHGVVANGSRWHNGRCEIQIKNSWGEIDKENPVNGQLNGWVDAEKVLDATFQLEYIAPRKK